MHMERLLSGRSRLSVAAVFGLMVLAAGTGAQSQYVLELPESVGDAKYVGEAVCRDCHEAIADSFKVGFHGMTHDFELPKIAVGGCEACHGPGSKHVEEGDTGLILNPIKQDGPLATRLCLQCHRTGGMRDFESTHHGMNDMSCTSCHHVHGPQRAGLASGKEPTICYECHMDVRSKTYLTSHHPIKEGHMVCSDCHDHHAGAYKEVMPGDRATDLCFSCHAAKQGPFVFEHAPVVEDCAICHDPHGTVANSLLKQNEPFLCLQCHQMHFHATLEGIEGEYTSLEGYSGLSGHDSAKRAMLTKCTQCHSEVHGSDFPSQAVSGQGKSLTR